MATQDIRGDMHSEENGRYVPKTAMGREAMRLFGSLPRHYEIMGQIPQTAWGGREDPSAAKRIANKIPDAAWERYNSTDENDDMPKYGSQEELDALLGEEFTGVKGQAAVDKLLKERRGHVKGAFHRDDIGDIDLFWGNDNVGLMHIIKQRLNDKKDITREKAEAHVERVLQHIEQTTSLGVLRKINKRGDREYVYNGYGVSIAPTYHGNRITYLLTAYSNEKSKQ